MCYCEDNEAKAYREITRKARKEYRCYECRSPIAIGESYTYISGIWDGGPDSFRWCLACTSLCKEAYEFARTSRVDGDRWTSNDYFCFVMGSLLECVIDFSEERQEAIAHAAKERERRERYATVVMQPVPR